MDTSKVFKVLNMFPFVKTESERTSSEFVNQRMREHQMLSKQRNAVSFCKKVNSIRTIDVSKITNEEKDAMETCLRENFLKDNPNYFGSRDVIYLDLHNYE